MTSPCRQPSSGVHSLGEVRARKMKMTDEERKQKDRERQKIRREKEKKRRKALSSPDRNKEKEQRKEINEARRLKRIDKCWEAEAAREEKRRKTAQAKWENLTDEERDRERIANNERVAKFRRKKALEKRDREVNRNASSANKDHEGVIPEEGFSIKPSGTLGLKEGGKGTIKEQEPVRSRVRAGAYSPSAASRSEQHDNTESNSFTEKLVADEIFGLIERHGGDHRDKMQNLVASWRDHYYNEKQLADAIFGLIERHGGDYRDKMQNLVASWRFHYDKCTAMAVESEDEKRL